MQYLVDRYDTEHKVSYPRGSREYYEVNNWLFWQNAGLGPMQGQSNHFTRTYSDGSPLRDAIRRLTRKLLLLLLRLCT